MMTTMMTMTVAGVPVAGVSAEGSNSTDFADPSFVACMRSSAVTPDSLERYVDDCIDRASAERTAFVTCMQTAARTPDALEHWVGPCATKAVFGRQ